jgi:hypothetical protein
MPLVLERVFLSLFLLSSVFWPFKTSLVVEAKEQQQGWGEIRHCEFTLNSQPSNSFLLHCFCQLIARTLISRHHSLMQRAFDCGVFCYCIQLTANEPHICCLPQSTVGSNPRYQHRFHEGCFSGCKSNSSSSPPYPMRRLTTASWQPCTHF